jgi:PAS domain S-box-containing protein
MNHLLDKLNAVAESLGESPETLLERWIDEHNTSGPDAATLHRLFDLSIDLLCVAGLDGYFQEVNPAFTRLLGYTREELFAVPFIEFIHPDDRESTRSEIEKLSKGLPIHSFENRYRAKDGGYCWLLWTSTCDPETGTIYAVAHDITQRKRLEQLQQDSREEVTRLLESVTDAFYALDLDWRFTYLNREAENLLGRTREQLLGKNVWREFPEAVKGKFYSEYHAALEENTTRSFTEFYPPLDTWFEVRVYPSPAGLSVYFRNINERIQMEETRKSEAELRANWEREKELSELKSRFISMVSHEFRTPLAVILSSAEMLKRYWERLELEKQHEYLDRIRAHVQHLKDLVSKVLDISSGDSIEMNYKPIPVDLQQFIEETTAELGFVVRETNRFVFTSDGVCETVRVDPALLRLAINNLVLNAARYSPYGSQIDVLLRCLPGLIQIQVSDQGIGIPPEEQKYLFNPFFRATNVGSVAGTGLGLAVVYHAVRAHGGTILVESEVGVGTTFKIVIPIAD